MRGAGAPGRRVFAVLLAVALFFCHGVFGASHVLAPGGGGPHAEAAPAATGEHRDAHPPGAGHAAPGHGGAVPDTGGEGGSAPHVGAADYFAVLLVLLGATALGLFPRGFFRAPSAGEAARVFRALPCFAEKPPPGGPSPPLLQVFRL